MSTNLTYCLFQSYQTALKKERIVWIRGDFSRENNVNWELKAFFKNFARTKCEAYFCSNFSCYGDPLKPAKMMIADMTDEVNFPNTDSGTASLRAFELALTKLSRWPIVVFYHTVPDRDLLNMDRFAVFDLDDDDDEVASLSYLSKVFRAPNTTTTTTITATHRVELEDEEVACGLYAIAEAFHQCLLRLPSSTFVTDLQLFLRARGEEDGVCFRADERLFVCSTDIASMAKRGWEYLGSLYPHVDGGKKFLHAVFAKEGHAVCVVDYTPNIMLDAHIARHKKLLRERRQLYLNRLGYYSCGFLEMETLLTGVPAYIVIAPTTKDFDKLPTWRKQTDV